MTTKTKTPSPKAAPKSSKSSPTQKSPPKAKPEKKSPEPKAPVKRPVYSEKQRDTALSEGRFNRVDGQKICGSLLITGAESTWVNKLSAGAKQDELFIYNIDQRIAGKPKDVAEFYSLMLGDKSDKQKLVESVIKNSVSFLNYDTTMKSEYGREIGRCQNAKLRLKTEKENKTQSNKLAELESAFVASKPASADPKKKSGPEKKKTSKTNTTK